MGQAKQRGTFEQRKAVAQPKMLKESTSNRQKPSADRFILISNSRQSLTSTNYWYSEYATHGLCYLSWNAGAARLLIPDSLESVIAEMRTADSVIVSQGLWHGENAVELLFEDHSDNPFCLFLPRRQTDRFLPHNDHCAKIEVTVYTRKGEQLHLPGRFRIVKSIPCLQAWGKI